MAMFIKAFFLLPPVFSLQNKSLTNNHKTLKLISSLYHIGTFFFLKKKKKPSKHINKHSHLCLFLCQVKFTPIWNCSPLTEAEFRDTIKENYFSAKKFNFGLSEEQVRSFAIEVRFQWNLFIKFLFFDATYSAFYRFIGF
jgi:hypothetical protein